MAPKWAQQKPDILPATHFTRLIVRFNHKFILNYPWEKLFTVDESQKPFIYSTNKYFSHCKGILVTGGFTSIIGALQDVATTTECYDVVTNPDGSKELKWRILHGLAPPDSLVSNFLSSSIMRI